MAIWHRDYTLAELNAMSEGNLGEHLAIEFTALGEDFLEGTMPVDHRTRQPYGLLHGGASLALAETLGSIAANLCVDPEHYRCVGQEINANHLRPVRDGMVRGVARPLHLGRSSQVWEIRIATPRGQLVCVSRLTVAVVNARVERPGRP